MSRKAPFASLMAITLSGILLLGDRAFAAIVDSGNVTFTDKGTTLIFDFSAAPELSKIAAGSKLVGIESHWTFTPGKGQSGALDLNASLIIPPTDLGAATPGFSITVDDKGATKAHSTSYADTGLVYSGTVLGELLGSGNNTMSGVLQSTGSAFNNLDSFFTNGGSVTGYLRLVTVEPSGPIDPGGGGDPGNVPEPSSLLVWGAIALGLIARRRKIVPQLA